MPRKKRITKKVLFQKTVEIMQPILKLQDWKLIVVFSYSSRMKETAACIASPEYKLAKIKANMNDIGSLKHNEIVAVAIHEMIHCILWELGEWAETLSKKDADKLELTRKYEEAAVTSFEKILLPIVTDQLNSQLSAQGYYDIDLTFTDFEIQHDRD
jgi:hypothetical protein